MYKVKKLAPRSYAYRIPGYLILETTKVGKYNTTKGKSMWVVQMYLRRVLKKACHMTLQEFYDEVELEITDKSQRPTCTYCGKPMRFTGEMRRGYTRHPDCTNTYCNRSCLAKHKHERYKIGFSNPATLIKTHRSYLLNRGKPEDYLNLYMAKLADGRMKFGVTCSMNHRILRSQQLSERGTIVKHIVLKVGLRRVIADLEYDIKLSNNYSEYIDNFEDMIRICRIVRNH